MHKKTMLAAAGRIAWSQYLVKSVEVPSDNKTQNENNDHRVVIHNDQREAQGC